MRGFTLLETIAVVVLLGLAVTTLAMSLAGPAEAARLRSAESVFLDLDRRARHAALRRGPVLLSVRDGSLEIAPGSGDSTVLATRPVPAGVKIELVGGRSELRVDALGRTEDYRARLTTERSEIVVRVDGLTGWHERIERSSP